MYNNNNYYYYMVLFNILYNNDDAIVAVFFSDMNTMVELTSFQALGRMQPFNVTMSSSAMAMVNIHSHLTTSEVVGYLAGQWDVTNHSWFLFVTKVLFGSMGLMQTQYILRHMQLHLIWLYLHYSTA